MPCVLYAAPWPCNDFSVAGLPTAAVRLLLRTRRVRAARRCLSCATDETRAGLGPSSPGRTSKPTTQPDAQGGAYALPGKDALAGQVQPPSWPARDPGQQPRCAPERASSPLAHAPPGLGAGG